MFAYTVAFFRLLDTLLVVGTLFLFMGLLIYVFLKEYSERRYQRRMEQTKGRLWTLFAESSDGMLKACPVLVRSFDLREIFDVVRYEDERYSPEFSLQIRTCMASSVDTKRIEQLAHRGRDKWQRIEGIAILGHFNTPQAAGILTANLDDTDGDVVYFSMLALSRSRTPETAGFLLRGISRGIVSGQKIVSLLEDFPSSAAESVWAELKNPDPSVRYWALKLLTRWRSVDAAPLVAASTNDADANVRAAACECLGALAQKEARGVLLDRLKDEAWFVRMFAVRALGVLFGSDALEWIAGLLNDASWPVKESVEKIMAQHIEKALPHLERCLVSSDDMTRASCVTTFVDAAYIPKILEDVLSGSSDNRERGRRLLGGLIRSRFYFGLKKALDGLEAGPKEEVLSVVAAIDEALAQKLK
jgi:hypothetical protein